MSDQPSTDGEEQLTGWDAWERYFVKAHGPHWREKRCGVNGYKCAYCSGRIKSMMCPHPTFSENVLVGGYTTRAEVPTPDPDAVAEPERESYA